MRLETYMQRLDNPMLALGNGDFCGGLEANKQGTAPGIKFTFPEPSSSATSDGLFFFTDANGDLASDWKNIPELRTSSTLGIADMMCYEATRQGNTYNVPDNAWPEVKKQRDAVAAFYQNFYSPSMGPNISPEHDFESFTKYHPACRNMTQLLTDGLSAVRRLENVDPAVGAHFNISGGANNPTISVGNP